MSIATGTIPADISIHPGPTHSDRPMESGDGQDQDNHRGFTRPARHPPDVIKSAGKNLSIRLILQLILRRSFPVPVMPCPVAGPQVDGARFRLMRTPLHAATRPDIRILHHPVRSQNTGIPTTRHRCPAYPEDATPGCPAAEIAGDPGGDIFQVEKGEAEVLPPDRPYGQPLDPGFIHSDEAEATRAIGRAAPIHLQLGQ